MKKKKPLRFTILFVPSESGDVRQYRVSADFIAIFLILCLLVIIGLVSYIAYSAGVITREAEEIEQLEKHVEIVTSSNIILQADKEKLENELSHALARIQTREYVQQQSDSAEALNYIPSGLPLDGQVSNPSDFSDESKSISFHIGDGSRIISSGAGKVMEVREDANFGYIVTIDHGNEYKSFYYYWSRPLVSKGDNVVRGTALFMAESEIPEFSYQITYQDNFIDPNTIMKIDG